MFSVLDKEWISIKNKDVTFGHACTVYMLCVPSSTQGVWISHSHTELVWYLKDHPPSGIQVDQVNYS